MVKLSKKVKCTITFDQDCKYPGVPTPWSFDCRREMFLSSSFSSALYLSNTRMSGSIVLALCSSFSDKLSTSSIYHTRETSSKNGTSLTANPGSVVQSPIGIIQN